MIKMTNRFLIFVQLRKYNTDYNTGKNENCTDFEDDSTIFTIKNYINQIVMKLT